MDIKWNLAKTYLIYKTFVHKQSNMMNTVKSLAIMNHYLNCTKLFI